MKTMKFLKLFENFIILIFFFKYYEILESFEMLLNLKKNEIFKFVKKNWTLNFFFFNFMIFKFFENFQILWNFLTLISKKQFLCNK